MIILGISGGFGHDAAAALVKDGVVVAACEEERFTRQKRASGQAAMHSLQSCLDMASINLSDVDCIAVGWDPRLAPEDKRLGEALSRFTSSHRIANDAAAPLHFVPHHLAHAALGFFTSGCGEAAVVVVDGQGETVSTSVFQGSGSTLRAVHSFGVPQSLGFFFNAATRYIGFTPGSAGKTMGLAALGKVTYGFPELKTSEDGYSVNIGGSNKAERSMAWLRRLEEVFGPAGDRKHSSDRSTGLLRTSVPVVPHLKDAAASVQAALDRVLSHLVSRARAWTGSDNVVLTGGVALNCSTNGRIREAWDGGVFFVNGAAHDGGTALGAALAVAAEQGELQQGTRLRSLFLGPEFDLRPALSLGRRLGLVVREPSGGVAQDVARRLLADEVGGWFRGRAEYGPRALGGRSIVARADSVHVRDRVNTLKGREMWRPIAPALSLQAAESLGIHGDGLDFMIEARWLPVDTGAGPLEGLIHVDGSVRPLVVEDQQHPFADLLTAVSAESPGVVANTSFNVDSEPMVNSPIDALRTFLSTDLDFLVLGDALLAKP